MKRDTPSESREALRTVFLGMSSNKDGQDVLKKFGANRFVPASPEDFGGVREVVKDSGHDLTKMKIVE
jgi:ABC-type phosphate/phosphonate transport system substrate-binding protein